MTDFLDEMLPPPPINTIQGEIGATIIEPQPMLIQYGTTVQTPQNLVTGTPTESTNDGSSFEVVGTNIDNYAAFIEENDDASEFDPDGLVDINSIIEDDIPDPEQVDNNPILPINQQSILLDLSRPQFKSDGAGGQNVGIWVTFDDVSGATGYTISVNPVSEEQAG
jgi:hypothetical protein